MQEYEGHAVRKVESKGMKFVPENINSEWKSVRNWRFGLSDDDRYPERHIGHTGHLGLTVSLSIVAVGIVFFLWYEGFFDAFF